MTDLAIAVVGSSPDPYAASPTVVLRLRIETDASERVHAMVLKVQLRIEPQRRRYGDDEAARLVELFGETPQWATSLRPFLWAHVAMTVGEFRGSVEVDLPVPLSYDLDVAAAKYLHSLGDGDVPIVLLFSGTVFRHRDGRLVVQPVPWQVEASHRLPVAVWRATMDGFFPNSGWIRLRRDTIDALAAYKATRALTTWDETFEHLLQDARP